MERALLIRQGLGSVAEEASPDGTGPSEQPTGWGTLRGNFRLAGAAPAPVPLTIDKEAEICAPGGKQQFSEQLVVGPDNGIANVLIYLSAAISDEEPWTHPSAAPGANQETAIFDQKECLFLTHVMALQVGQPMEIRNSDPTGHNTNILNTPFNQMVPSGAAVVYEHKREEREPIPVSCSIHPWMKAWLIARDNGYFAVTKPDGSFEIANLPAGVDLEFRVWQEKLGFVRDVNVDGAGESWKKGKFTRRLDVGDNQLSVTIEARQF
jgi:hypothetical protein